MKEANAEMTFSCGRKTTEMPSFSIFKNERYQIKNLHDAEVPKFAFSNIQAEIYEDQKVHNCK